MYKRTNFFSVFINIFKKNIFLLFLTIFFSFNQILSYQVDLPSSTSDVKSESIIDGWSYYVKLSKTINTYLWIAVWFVSLIVVLYAWFLLVSSSWNPEDLKKANKMLIWWLVWIFVSLLSYLIIKLMVKLF